LAFFLARLAPWRFVIRPALRYAAWANDFMKSARAFAPATGIAL
jgi:hypothetical protein